MKRIIAILMVVCFLTLALAACGKKKSEKPTATPGPTETEAPTGKYGEADLNSKLEDPLWYEKLDFEEEALTILVRQEEQAIREWGSEDVEDSDLGENINLRNEVVESTLNLSADLAYVSGYTSYDDLLAKTLGIIQDDVDNKIHEIDIVANFAYIAPQMGIRDYNANLMDKDTFPHFNFTLPCWNQTIIKNTAINNNMYFIAGDINISTFNKLIVMWYNIALYDQVKGEDDPEDIQELAVEGYWNYQELYRWSSYVVPSGENLCDYTYGVGIWTGKANGIPYDALPAAFDIDLIKTNADGTHAYEITETAEAAVQDWFKVMNADGNAFSQTCISSCKCSGGIHSHFTEGKILFMADVLYRSKEYNLAMREMEQAYGILPMPKYDEEQPNYGTVPADSYTLLTVIDHSESTVATKGEAVSAYLEYMTEYSYENVRQYYFYEVIETKYFGQDDSDGHVSNSKTIFKEILNNIELSFYFIYSPMLNNSTWLWRDTLNGTFGLDGTLSARYEQEKDAYDEAVYELDKWLGLTN